MSMRGNLPLVITNISGMYCTFFLRVGFFVVASKLKFCLQNHAHICSGDEGRAEGKGGREHARALDFCSPSILSV